MNYYDIRNRLDRILHEKLRAEYGESAVTREPIISEITGHNFGDREVAADPLQAIEEADRIAKVARSLANDYAKKARRHGRSWDEIGQAFGFDTDEVPGPAIQAYERVVEASLSATPSWKCACCSQRVTDRGPWEPHPADSESGHASDCERHHREIAAYERCRDWYTPDRSDGPNWDMDL